MKEEEEKWFEKWLKQNQVYDKDTKKFHSVKDNEYQPFKKTSSTSKTNQSNQETKSNHPKAEEESWFESWLEEDNEVHDKDSKNSGPTTNTPNSFRPFKNNSIKATNQQNHRKLKKFYIEEKNSLDKWLDKNEVFDKDQALKEKEQWMYPPENLYSIRIDSTIDLHRLTVKQALLTLHHFIKNCFNKNDRVVRVIHGKGNHSHGGPKVKRAVIQWLKTEGKGFIHFYKEADPKHGGAGATIVWLR